MNEYYQNLEVIEGALSSSIGFEMFKRQDTVAKNLIDDSIILSMPIEQLVDNVVYNQVNEIQKKINGTISCDILNGALTTQLNTFVYAQQNIQTPAITNLLDNFQNLSWTTGMKEFTDEITTGYTSAANLALFKNVKGLEYYVPEDNQCIIKPVINKILKRTSERLAKDKNIEVNVKEESFRTVYDVTAHVGLQNMNVIASSTELFADITESDLIIFIDKLSKEPEFSSEDPTGQKIWQIIKDWNSFVGFDRDFYFHARPLDKNKKFFISEELGKAPCTMVTSGRFNHAIQSHYYFSDTVEGAETEVRKHNPNSSIQTARLKPKRDIRMIDLSEEILKKNLFLEYLRYQPTPKSKNPTEYLFPQYVSTCCKKAGIDGIKYYGSKKYKNYVSWEGDYFEIVNARENMVK